MKEFNRFSEHHRIDQYLKKKNTLSINSNSVKRYDNILQNFTVGLIIITKDDFKFEDRIEFINKYACKLFKIKESINIKELKEKFNEFVKLKSNNSMKYTKTLSDVIFNYSSLNYDFENFIPFESTYSKSIVLYIKINEIEGDKFIVIDKYDKYIEERKYIELNLIKTINYQYLHTLYHELNNPLNALLAISGDSEKPQIFSSEITNSRIENNISIIPRKGAKSCKKINHHMTCDYKKEKNYCIGAINNNNKLGFTQDILEVRRKRIFPQNQDLNDKIPLLVNIIKIFIKNFILYLKTRADNLITLKNEFDIQNETSDIMNVVEVSEYERELTKHKMVKINLEYIFSMYFDKFGCLFKYKEIDCKTNFEKLRNYYVVTDEFNFIYYIRQIYTYLYYIVPKKDGFIFEFAEIEEFKSIKIMVKKITNENIIKNETFDILKSHKNHKDNKENKSDMTQIIQTKEMTKEVLYSMSKRLNFVLEIYDLDNIELNSVNNLYLSIVIPIEKKDKSEEEDEFKDEDINEMVQKDLFLLEDKLKRQFPICDNYEKKKSNHSTNNILDIISKNDKDYSESSIYLQKKDKCLNINSNNNKSNFKKSSDKSLNISNGSQNKIFALSKKSNDTFLNKCLLTTDIKKTEKDYKDKEIYKHHKVKSDNLLKLNNAYPKKRTHCSDKGVTIKEIKQKSEKEIKSQKLSGVFTKINNLGLSQELDMNDVSITNITAKSNKKTNVIETTSNKNVNITAKNKEIKENINNLENSEMNVKTKNSGNTKATINDIKNPKIKASYIIADAMDREKKNINNNIHNNNIINIINDHSIHNNNIKKNAHFHKSSPKDDHSDLKNEGNLQNADNSPLKCEIQELDKAQPKRYSQNITPQINQKDCMTFFPGDKRETISKSNNQSSNQNFFENISNLPDSNKNRNKTKYITHQLDEDSDESEESKESKDSKENKEYNFSVEEHELEHEQEEEQEHEQEKEEENTCNCQDILIVDDEEFNVMASQKMIQRIGFESDVAFNGEECINLIKEKQKVNCNCDKNFYKIIFLDIVMPVLDGITTAKKIQEMIDNKEINENIKIIFVSGNIDGNELKESLLKINCVKECLQKPVRIEKYQKIIEKYYNVI